MFDDPNGQMEASFGIALFCCGPAVRGLEPKERHDSCPLAGDYMTMYLGILTVLWVYPHSHPPRMTDFISHAQESRYKLFELQFAFVELRTSRKFVPRLAISSSVYTTELSICT